MFVYIKTHNTALFLFRSAYIHEEICVHLLSCSKCFQYWFAQNILEEVTFPVFVFFSIDVTVLS